jgi:hypothetical protein
MIVFDGFASKATASGESGGFGAQQCGKALPGVVKFFRGCALENGGVASTII